MMNFPKRIFLFLAFFSVSVFSRGQEKNELRIRFKPVINGKVLNIGDQWSVTRNGDSVQIHTFKFYISDICVTEENGKLICENKSVHLLDFEDKVHEEVLIRNCGSKVLKIAFWIGVDSIHHVSGALEGDLDPAKGMFWAWNTGYIAAKLEGRSPSCHSRDKSFEYHIGGYRTPYNSRRKVELTIESKNDNEVVCIEADAGMWLDGQFGIKLQSKDHIVEPCKEAMQMADSYQRMFHQMKNDE